MVVCFTTGSKVKSKIFCNLILREYMQQELKELQNFCFPYTYFTITSILVTLHLKKIQTGLLHCLQWFNSMKKRLKNISMCVLWLAWIGNHQALLGSVHQKRRIRTTANSRRPQHLLKESFILVFSSNFLSFLQQRKQQQSLCLSV